MDREQPAGQVLPEQTLEESQPTTHAQKRFYTSALCNEARVLLQALVDNPDYNTDPSPHTANPVPFVERHLRHLSMYPKTNLIGYMSNLKLMTNVKHARPRT